MDENQADREIANAEAQINLLNHKIGTQKAVINLLEQLQATEERKQEAILENMSPRRHNTISCLKKQDLLKQTP